MKLFTGWIMSAALVLTTAAANAQVLAPYGDGGQSYPAPRYGPMLLPPQEVYTVVRDSGFSPLGIPQQRGLVYTISVIDRGGDDGRLVIDARTGRIIRFMPAYRMGDNANANSTASYGPVGPLPPISQVTGPPRPPRAIPRVANRTAPVAMPRPTQPHGDESSQLPTKPSQQSAGVQAKPADAQMQAAAPAIVAPKPAAPQLKPTEEMPKVQGLE